MNSFMTEFLCSKLWCNKVQDIDIFLLPRLLVRPAFITSLNGGEQLACKKLQNCLVEMKTRVTQAESSLYVLLLSTSRKYNKQANVG